MGRGDAAKATPRIRNKITHKTRLRIVHGDIDTDRSFPDEDNDGRTLATGVDAEDANEYHLLAVLAASNQPSTFCQPTSASQSPANNRKSAPAPTAPPPSVLFIPTPDATGKVDNYSQLYYENAWQPSLSNIKFSDTVEECQTDALAGGYSYVMDEKDADWLEKNNKAANGEGSSNGVPSTPRADSARRSAKSRGKEPEAASSTAFAITDDEFELVMGLFEKLTDEKMPFLHLTPTDMPLFSDFEAFFASPVPPHYVPTFIVSSSFPQPAQLSKLARAVYPHWRDRKSERAGRRIIPQLNYDESNEGDPYVCFRRREAKPVRKTRRQDTTSVDRMLKLQTELSMASKLANLVLQREQAKIPTIRDYKTVCDARIRLVEVKRKYPVTAGVNDDELFVDRIVAKKQKIAVQPGAESGVGQGAGGTIRIKTSKRDAGYESQLVMGGAAGAPVEHINALQRIAEIQSIVERHLAKRKDNNWEDVTENAFQPLPVSIPQRHFRSLRVQSSPSPSQQQPRSARPISFRSRMGRGGRLLLDRRLPSVRHPLDEPSNYSPPSLSQSLQANPTPYKIKHELLTQSYLSKPSVYGDAENGGSGADSGETDAVDEEDEEWAVARAAELQDRAWKTEERWRYDADIGIVVGGVIGLGDGEDGEEVRLIVDDYDSDRQWPLRKKLLLEEDFNHLMRTDDRHIHAAAGLYDARMEKQATMAAAAAARRRAVSVSSANGSRGASVQPPQAPLPPLQAQTTGGSTSQPTPISNVSTTVQVNGVAGSPISIPNGNPVAIAVPASSQPQQAGQQAVASAAAAKKLQMQMQMQMQMLASRQQQQAGNQIAMNGIRQQQPQSQINGVPTGKPVSQGSPPISNMTSASLPDSSPSPTLKALNGVPNRPPPLMNGNGANGLFISHQQQLKNVNGMFNGTSQPISQTQLSPTLQQITQVPQLTGAGNMPLKLPAQRQMQWAAAAQNQRTAGSATSPIHQHLDLNGMSPQQRASQSPITPNAIPPHLHLQQQQQQAGGRLSPVNGVARLGAASAPTGGRSSPANIHHSVLHGGHGHSMGAHSSSPLAGVGVGVSHLHQQTVVGGPGPTHVNGY